MSKKKLQDPLTGGTTGWKQPTPVDIHNDNNFNELDRMIFFYAWSMVRREPGVYEFWNGNRFFSVVLDRGQCILKVSRIADDLEINRKRVRQSIEKLQKWYTSLDIEQKPYGLILTFKWVDKMLKMDNELHNERTMREQWANNESTTSKKNVETEEREKNEKITDSNFNFSAQPQTQQLDPSSINYKTGELLPDNYGVPLDKINFFDWTKVDESN